MDIQQAVDAIRDAPVGERHDTLYRCWFNLPAATDLKPLAQAAVERGLDEREVQAVLLLPRTLWPCSRTRR